jgi:hypothetical protein
MKEELKPEELADQIMRWDWRDMFREDNKKAIIEMLDEYRKEIISVAQIENSSQYICNCVEPNHSGEYYGRCNDCDKYFLI